jgi:hypothetical protein
MNSAIASVFPAKSVVSSPFRASASSYATTASGSANVLASSAGSYAPVQSQSGPAAPNISKLQKKCERGLLGKCKKLSDLSPPGPPQTDTIICQDGCGSSYETTGSCRPQEPCNTGVIAGKNPVLPTPPPSNPWCDMLGIGCGPAQPAAPQTPTNGAPGSGAGPASPPDDSTSIIDLFARMFGGQISAGAPTSTASDQPGVLVMPAAQEAASSGTNMKPIVLLLILAAVVFGGYKLWKKYKG